MKIRYLARVFGFTISLTAAGTAWSNDALVVDALGNVGVATDTPDALFHVKANEAGFPFAFLAENAGSDFAGFRFRTTGGDIDFNKAGSNFRINIVDGDSWEFQIAPSGDLTIEGSYLQKSSRTFKENITLVDTQSILEKVISLPIAEWEYKTDESDQRHMGPMAEEFAAAFQLGQDSRYISVADMAGVTMAAVKALASQVDTKNAELQNLQQKIQWLTEDYHAENSRLKAENTELLQRIERIEALLQSAHIPTKVNSNSVLTSTEGMNP